MTIPQACEQLSLGEARFHELRTEWLQAAAAALEPKPLGRPTQTTPEERDEMKRLRERADAVADVVALIGTLLLGLDHGNLLYNRMALMDTPAAFLMVSAFYAFVRSQEETKEGGGAKAGARWAVVCGAMLGLTYATRGITRWC